MSSGRRGLPLRATAILSRRSRSRSGSRPDLAPGLAPGRVTPGRVTSTRRATAPASPRAFLLLSLLVPSFTFATPSALRQRRGASRPRRRRGGAPVNRRGRWVCWRRGGGKGERDKGEGGSVGDARADSSSRGAARACADGAPGG